MTIDILRQPTSDRWIEQSLANLDWANLPISKVKFWQLSIPNRAFIVEFLPSNKIPNLDRDWVA
jgi:hypothetical protein